LPGLCFFGTADPHSPIELRTEERKQPSALFQYFNTTGSNLQHAEVEAAVELLIPTRGGEIYQKCLNERLKKAWDPNSLRVRSFDLMDQRVDFLRRQLTNVFRHVTLAVRDDSP